LREKVGTISEMIPNAGRIMMYTSGWPKNQNTCWYITGSPPAAALKKLVPKKRSNSIIVTAPASTGITAITRNEVISHDQQNIGIFKRSRPGARRLRIVAMILIEPRMDEMPIRWIAKIMKAMASPPCSTSGGYIVQPAAGAPPGMKNVDSSRMNANGSIQNDRLFKRGSAMSGAPICIGIIQFARPTNSIRNENDRYSVPMSLWLVDMNQRSKKPWWCSSWWMACAVLDMVRILGECLCCFCSWCAASTLGGCRLLRRGLRGARGLVERRGVFLFRKPGVELILRQHLDHDRHGAVVLPAQHVALAAIDAGLVHLGPGVVHDAGNGVALGREIGHPPAVDHVVGRDQEAHLDAGRD